MRRVLLSVGFLLTLGLLDWALPGRMGFRLAPGDLATSIIALALVYGAVGVFIGSIAQATSNKSENAWAASMAFFAVLFALSHSALGVWVLITSGAFGVIVYHASRRAAVTGPAPTRHLD